jgi:hypothetical protein
VPSDTQVEKMKQLKVNLEDAVREELEKASAETGRSLADEIRSRLRISQGADAETRALAEQIVGLALDLQAHKNIPWHSHPKAHEALATAIQTFLEGWKSSDAAADWGPDDPQTLGRAIGRERLRFVMVKIPAALAALRGDKS